MVDMEQAMQRLLKYPKEQLASALLGYRTEMLNWRTIALVAVIGNVIQFFVR